MITTDETNFPSEIEIITGPDPDYFQVVMGKYKFVFNTDHLWMVDTFEEGMKGVDVGYFETVDTEKVLELIVWMWEWDEMEVVAAELAEL